MEDLERRLQNILFYRTGIDFQQKEIYDLNFFGTKLKIPPRELLLVCLDIEKELGVQITEKDILDGNFKTYNKMLNVISKKVKI